MQQYITITIKKNTKTLWQIFWFVQLKASFNVIKPDMFDNKSFGLLCEI